MAGQNINIPYQQILLAVTATGTTTTSPAIVIPMMDVWTFHINTTTGTGTTPTLNVVLLYTPDGGTTYLNAPVRFAQITATGNNLVTFKATGLTEGEAGHESAVADTGGTLSQNFVLPAIQSTGNASIKFKYTIGGTNPSFAFTIYASGRKAGANQ